VSRRDAILLISRALAVVEFVNALVEITYLPVRIMSFLHHERQVSVLVVSATDAFYRSYYAVDIAFLFARCIGLLLLAWVLWHCGPWVEQVLLPKREEPGQSS